MNTSCTVTGPSYPICHTAAKQTLPASDSVIVKHWWLDAEILLSGHGKHKSKKKIWSIKSICSGRTRIYHLLKQVVNKIQKCLVQILMNRDATGDTVIVFERNPQTERWTLYLFQHIDKLWIKCITSTVGFSLCIPSGRILNRLSHETKAVRQQIGLL